MWDKHPVITLLREGMQLKPLVSHRMWHPFIVLIPHKDLSFSYKQMLLWKSLLGAEAAMDNFCCRGYRKGTGKRNVSASACKPAGAGAEACSYWPTPTCRQQNLHPSTTGRDELSWEEASKETDSAMKSENKWLLRHLFSLCAENTQWKHEMQHARRVLLLIIYDFINILL